MYPIHFYNSLLKYFVITIYLTLSSDINFSHQSLRSFLTAAQPNPLGTTQLDASNIYTQIFHIKTFHPPLLQIIYNQSHVLKFHFTPTSTQKHYPQHETKQFSPLLDA